MKLMLRPFFNRRLLFHIVGWAVFIVYEVSLVLIVESALGRHSPAWLFLISYTINICLFYVHALLVLDFCLSKKRRRISLLILCILFELLIYVFLIGLLQPRGTNRHLVFYYFSTDQALARAVWRGIYFMIFSTAYWLVQRSFDRTKKMQQLERNILIEEKEKQQLKLELVSTQNAFLRAQINPHFLFNALNFIHNEVQEVSERASDVVITLSDMMRYSLIENKADGKVDLQKEIEQIENLIKINQYRFNNKLNIKLRTKGSFINHRIVPLLLVPIAENLFKYAELTDPNNPALIDLSVIDSTLTFFVSNKKRLTVPFSSNGIGIENIKTRLRSSYSDRFSLNIINNDTLYSINLEINL